MFIFSPAFWILFIFLPTFVIQNPPFIHLVAHDSFDEGSPAAAAATIGSIIQLTRCVLRAVQHEQFNADKGLLRMTYSTPGSENIIYQALWTLRRISLKTH